MTDRELYTLANYNSEVQRGIIHTEAWRQQMAKLQMFYDAEWEARIGLVRPFHSYGTPSAISVSGLWSSAA